MYIKKEYENKKNIILPFIKIKIKNKHIYRENHRKVNKPSSLNHNNNPKIIKLVIYSDSKS